MIRCDGHNGEYCYYIKGEGKDRVRGNETSIYPEFLKPNTNIGVGNLPLNGVISDNRTYPGKTAGVLSGKRAPELMNMDLGAISARQSAPTDGRDPFVNPDKQDAFYTSKQNSDAFGMLYQWGHKDPFTFATNSGQWGALGNQYGKYSVKIYTIDGVLIYQEKDGSSNKDKQPAGGIIATSTLASSMMETIKNPILFYNGNPYSVITQVGHKKSLWDYYWTSYSRGTDGKINTSMWRNEPTWHNHYLADYLPQRLKSIYDPCPFGFRGSSNGTYNQFDKIQGWTDFNYTGGSTLTRDGTLNWIPAQGYRSVAFYYVGSWCFYRISTSSNTSAAYDFQFSYNTEFRYNNSRIVAAALSVRCIEDCDPQSDDFALSICHAVRLQKFYNSLSAVEDCDSQTNILYIINVQKLLINIKNEKRIK